MPARLPRQPLLEHGGDLLERAVLQQPREEQVARLEQREVVLVLDVALRAAAGPTSGRAAWRRPRRNDEVCSRSHSPSAAAPALTCAMNSSVTRESDDLGDVELVLGDQAEQQVEGALEVVEPDLEAGLGEAVRSRVGSGVGGERHPGSFFDEPLDEEAVVAVLLEVGQHQRDRLAHERPRSTASPCSRRSDRRALLEVEQLVGGDVDGHLLVVPDPPAGPARALARRAGRRVARRGTAALGAEAPRPRPRSPCAASVGRNRSSAVGRLTRRDTAAPPPWPAGGRTRRRPRRWRRT